MKVKSSAHYQREYRRRLREQGLVKKEVWIRPEHSTRLTELEKQLRLANGINSNRGAHTMNTTKWNTTGLYSTLITSDMFVANHASVELIDGIDPSLLITLHEYGDLPVFLSISGDQIIVESVLWPMSYVTSVDKLNLLILKTHKLIPLSTISVEKAGDGKNYYHMFGALSAASSLNDILFEIDVLGANVIQAVEAYGDFLSIPNKSEGKS